jgi:hypothetical protein
LALQAEVGSEGVGVCVVEGEFVEELDGVGYADLGLRISSVRTMSTENELPLAL